MADVAGMLGEVFGAFASSTVLARLLAALLILLVSLAVLVIVKKILFGVAAARVRDKNVVENTYRVVKASLGAVTLFLILYVVTMQEVIIVFLLAVVIVVMAASWEIIANVISYYALQLYQVVQRGEYISVGEYEGRVRELTPLFTIVENDRGVYAVPNRLILNRGRVLYREPVPVGISLRVWGIEEPRALEDLIMKIRERLEPALRAVSASPGDVSLYIDEIAGDSVSLKFEVLLPGPRINKARLDTILREIASFMWSTGYSFSVAIEKPNGGARWR